MDLYTVLEDQLEEIKFLKSVKDIRFKQENEVKLHQLIWQDNS